MLSEEEERRFSEFLGKAEYFNSIRSYYDALEYFEKALELDPYNVTLYMKIGIVNKNLDNIELSEHSLRKAIEYSNEEKDIEFFMGLLEFYIYEDKTSAIEHFLRCLEINSDDYLSHYYLSLTYFKIGDYEESLKGFNRAIEINPNDSNSYCGRGIIFNKLKNYDEAIHNFDKSISLTPFNTMVFNNKGYAYMVTKRHDLAIECFDKMTALNPLDTSAYYNKAITYQTTGKFSQAIECYDMVLSLDPEDMTASRNRSYCLGEFHAEWIFRWKSFFNDLYRIIFL